MGRFTTKCLSFLIQEKPLTSDPSVQRSVTKKLRLQELFWDYCGSASVGILESTGIYREVRTLLQDGIAVVQLDCAGIDFVMPGAAKGFLCLADEFGPDIMWRLNLYNSKSHQQPELSDIRTQMRHAINWLDFFYGKYEKINEKARARNTRLSS